uniref:Uncharacterized protein n=1 Tax=Moniliophthora roreri TaxID=221103 RepID=A0A0W0FXW7_MONRR
MNFKKLDHPSKQIKDHLEPVIVV